MDKQVKCPRCGTINRITDINLQDCQAAGCPQSLVGQPAYIATPTAPETEPHPVISDEPSTHQAGQAECDSAFRLRWAWGHLTPLKDKLVVGRDMTGDETLRIYLEANHINVSRRHAVFELREGVVYVEDLKSLNGTYLGDRRVPHGEPTPLKPGDRVSLARQPAVEVEIVHG